MIVTIYANGIMIPEDEIDNFQIMNDNLVAFLCSVKERIQKETDHTQKISPIVTH